jgi:hypothetical protein
MVSGLEQVLVGVEHPLVDVERHLHGAFAVELVALARELDEALCVDPRLLRSHGSSVRRAPRDAVRDPVLLGSKAFVR